MHRLSNSLSSNDRDSIGYLFRLPFYYTAGRWDIFIFGVKWKKNIIIIFSDGISLTKYYHWGTSISYWYSFNFFFCSSYTRPFSINMASQMMRCLVSVRPVTHFLDSLFRECTTSRAIKFGWRSNWSRIKSGLEQKARVAHHHDTRTCWFGCYRSSRHAQLVWSRFICPTSLEWPSLALEVSDDLVRIFGILHFSKFSCRGDWCPSEGWTTCDSGWEWVSE